MYNYNNGGYGYPMMQQQSPEQPIFNQLLTTDEVAKLQKSPTVFSTKLTEDEFLRAVCTHKDNNNHIMLEKLTNGKHRCTICQAEFFLVDLNAAKEDIEKTCNDFNDLLQSIKTYYGNAPTALREFYLMVGYIPKITHLWNVAKQYFDKVTGGYGGGLVPNSDQSGFATLSNILGNGAMMGLAPMMAGGYNGGYIQQVPQQGYYAQQPMPQAAYVQTPQQPMMQQANPFQQFQQQQVPQQQQPYPSQVYQPVPPQQPMMQQPMQPMQQPMYGYANYNPNMMVPMQQPMQQNPIGYVEQPNPQRDFTQTVNQAGQPQSQTQTPPMPAPPANPNVVKADVSKKFNG